MRIRTLIKILLIITGGLCVLCTALQWTELEFYIKPTTVPLFFMLYWFSVKKTDSLFLIILLLCFLGDIFLLVDINNSFVYVLLSYTICYLILFYYLYKNYTPVDYSNVDIIYLAVFFVAWTYIAYEIYDATQGTMDEIRPYGVSYLIILYLLFIGAVFQYVNIRSSQSLWFLIAVLNFVISDSCFALNRFYIPAIEFEIINSIYQLLAVFFLVQFKISSPTSLKLKNI
ncbi:lysoplasmalogenase family protein [Aquimarina gracilis]|uniref:Lysoplasmalogenase family protein n=1 Tax=Aquimarina gracilis TaxID=874422 RepID=A0ABU5ZUR5_9FLAO|nr:lysoplasmalogenase family protein [Aquimarina gracilis]MEB3345546.1 lysoplasmalogenase family protein [Aquimarina gracilis]